jgi:hypothetical protein
MIWFVFALAVYSLAGAFVMKTKNVASSMIFKVIPFFLGAATLLYVLKTLEVL